MATTVTFSREIANLLHAAGGEPVSSCMQCGTCSGTCPVSDFMDVRPQRLIRMIDAGLKDQVMATRSFWYCASCYQCTVRCPRGIDIAELMYGLKRYTIWKKQYPEDLIGPAFSETFVKNIVRTGRSYEPVLATSYFFTLGLKEMLQEAQGATMLMLKGRLPVLPARIKRLENFKRMIKRIIPIGDE
ncbi:MAG: 4Fe-4S dicluster domain-containing protein [Verrucomicrobia bacterium]|nr:4Fe-4S dicluster domain-containing protein [Verrucomicrobiota bacterium]